MSGTIKPVIDVMAHVMSPEDLPCIRNPTLLGLKLKHEPLIFHGRFETSSLTVQWTGGIPGSCVVQCSRFGAFLLAVQGLLEVEAA